jgi:hypothetical protein
MSKLNLKGGKDMKLFYMVNSGGATFGIVEEIQGKYYKQNGYFYSLGALRYAMKKRGVKVSKLPSQKMSLVTWA